MSKPRATTARARAAQLVTFTAGTVAPAAGADRELEGLIVPFGPTGATNVGLLRFTRGALSWSSDVRRVKLLLDHDQKAPVGHAVALEERDDGIWGRFRVPAGDAGDRILAEAANGLRDGLSVGMALDAATEDRLRRAQRGQAVAGAGVIRETSLVAVPAFDDARVGAMAGATAATGPLITFDGAGGSTFTGAPTTPPPPAAQAGAGGSQPAAGAGASAVAAPAAQATAQGASGAGAAASPTLAAASTAAPAPRVAAGAAVTIASAPSTYRFDGTGPSLVRDAFYARVEGDPEAAARLRAFNAELRDGNRASVASFLQAASAGVTTGAGDLATFAPIASPADTGDVNIPGAFLPSGNRADLMLRAVNAGRPIASRLTRVAITNAQPFMIPIEGDFTGVADHTEGTPHVAEGTLTLSDTPVQPRAVSGAYRVSRELVDATNPAIDQIVMRAMLRDYRRVSEQKVIDAIVAADATVTYGVNTAMELRAELVDFVNDDDEPADFVAGGRSFLAALFAEVDADGRPMIASGSTAPTATTSRAGYLGINIDGTDLIRASRLPATRAVIVRGDGVLFLESAVQQFRFDEIEGPGLIKLALWAYVGAAVLRAEDVRVIDSGVAP